MESTLKHSGGNIIFAKIYDTETFRQIVFSLHFKITIV